MIHENKKYQLVYSTRKIVEPILTERDKGRKGVPLQEWVGMKTTEFMTTAEIKERYGKDAT